MRFVYWFLFRTPMGLTGQSSNPCDIGVAENLPHGESGGYWIARSSQVKPGDDSMVAWPSPTLEMPPPG
jgi:hypothetical protein